MIFLIPELYGFDDMPFEHILEGIDEGISESRLEPLGIMNKWFSYEIWCSFIIIYPADSTSLDYRNVVS